MSFEYLLLLTIVNNSFFFSGTPTKTPTYPTRLPQPTCGRDTLTLEERDTAGIVKRIIGGERATKHHWVWQVNDSFTIQTLYNGQAHGQC